MWGAAGRARGPDNRTAISSVPASPAPRASTGHRQRRATLQQGVRERTETRLSWTRKDTKIQARQAWLVTNQCTKEQNALGIVVEEEVGPLAKGRGSVQVERLRR